MKKTKWKIMLFVGTIPFLVALAYGTYVALTGFSFLFSPPSYGIQAFIDCVFLYSYLYWPTYVVGLILMIWALVQLYKKEPKDKE